MCIFQVGCRDPNEQFRWRIHGDIIIVVASTGSKIRTILDPIRGSSCRRTPSVQLWDATPLAVSRLLLWMVLLRLWLGPLPFSSHNDVDSEQLYQYCGSWICTGSYFTVFSLATSRLFPFISRALTLTRRDRDKREGWQALEVCPPMSLYTPAKSSSGVLWPRKPREATQWRRLRC